MDIKDLRYFMAVYESKGFARAGISLHTVQSNVSARIKKLETGFGARLFERHPHGIAATEQGEALYAYATRLIALVDEIEHAIGSGPPLDARHVAASKPAFRGCDHSRTKTMLVE